MQISTTDATPKPTAPRELLRDVCFVRLSLEEGTGDGKVRVKGEFAKCGIATENKRVYPEGVWSKEIGRLGKAFNERRVFGEMDHPADGRTSLQRVSHIVTSLKVGKDGLVIGEAEILPTEAGKNLAALLNSGCKVGVSSRGYGSTKSNDKGEEVVQQDYKLVTFDFVAEPADSDAYPDVHTESTNLIFEGVDMNAEQEKEQKQAAEFARMVMAGDKKPAPGTEAAAENDSVREEFSRDVLANIVKMKTEVREQLRAEMAADPAVAGAKNILDQVKDLVRPFMLEGDSKAVVEAKDAEIQKLKNQIAERDLKVSELEEENSKLADIAKEAGYKFWMERTLAADPDADSIRKFVGDVKSFANVDELKSKVESIRKELTKKREETKAVDEARKAEILKATAAIEEGKKIAETRAAKLEEALTKALTSEKGLALKLYAEQRLTNHPKAAKIRSLMENSEFSSKEDVDKLVDSFREKARDPDELEEVRARVRAVVKGGDEDSPLSEEKLSPPSRTADVGSYNGLGLSVGELKKLSGLRK